MKKYASTCASPRRLAIQNELSHITKKKTEKRQFTLPFPVPPYITQYINKAILPFCISTISSKAKGVIFPVPIR